jgi:hypothetical protein
MMNSVMAGLVPAIHDFAAAQTWMPGTSAGHDEKVRGWRMAAGA